MKAISVEEYIQLRAKLEPNINIARLRSSVQKAIRDKLEGYRCRHCRGELWAVGAVITEDHLCDECMGLEPGSEYDVEFDVVLEKVY